MKLVLIGAGQRGMGYATFAHENRRADIVAVAEPHAGRRAAAAHAFGLREDACFTSAEALFAQGKLADAAIIASMDRDHYQQAMDALDLGYHLLLEK
ncbi:MAG: Gfo/Idh/MocA family oxidoreductase, partial [Clostridia bacterium]